MENKNVISRRHFIVISSLSIGSVSLLNGCKIKVVSYWRFFSEAESKLIDAIADQIIPVDDNPGGKEAGVTNFIDKQLDGPYTRYKKTYRRGMMAIQETCKVKFRKQFEELPFVEQTRFLENMEAGNMEGHLWKDGFDQQFFSLIRAHSMQGYYGSPRHGGNKNNVSYKMMKLDYPVIIGQNRYNI